MRLIIIDGHALFYRRLAGGGLIMVYGTPAPDGGLHVASVEFIPAKARPQAA